MTAFRRVQDEIEATIERLKMLHEAEGAPHEHGRQPLPLSRHHPPKARKKERRDSVKLFKSAMQSASEASAGTILTVLAWTECGHQ